MSRYQRDQRVAVFDPRLQRDVPGTVLACSVTTALVALDDRMRYVTVDPANSLAIQPLEGGGRRE